MRCKPLLIPLLGHTAFSAQRSTEPGGESRDSERRRPRSKLKQGALVNCEGGRDYATESALRDNLWVAQKTNILRCFVEESDELVPENRACQGSGEAIEVDHTDLATRNDIPCTVRKGHCNPPHKRE